MNTLYFLLGTVFVVGRAVWLMTMFEAHAHQQMCRNIAQIKARRRSGGATQAGSAPPAAAAPHGPGVTRTTAHPASPPDHLAPAATDVGIPQALPRSCRREGSVDMRLPRCMSTDPPFSVGGGCRPASPPTGPFVGR